jgi:hypothetical protein
MELIVVIFEETIPAFASRDLDKAQNTSLVLAASIFQQDQTNLISIPFWFFLYVGYSSPS